MDLPQADPEPCPGYSLKFLSKAFTFWIDQKSMPARSSAEIVLATAKSGLPTYLRKTVSPVKIQNYFPS